MNSEANMNSESNTNFEVNMDCEGNMDANAKGSDYSTLPLEILVKIQSYLSAHDVKSTIQTSRQWLCASQFPEIQKKIVLTVTKKIETIQYIFTTTFRKFPHILLYKMNSFIYLFTLPNIYTNVESITFRSCDISLDIFTSIIENMQNLKTLVFENTTLNCNDLEKYYRKYELHKRIAQLQSITFICRKNFIISNFCSTIKLFRNSERLQVFKIEDRSVTKSLFEENFQICLYEIIKRNANTLQELQFPYLFSTDDFLNDLNLVYDLQLKIFRIQYLRIKWTNFYRFIRVQNQLLKINLSSCPQINDDDIETLVQNLKLIEDINLNNCNLITNHSLINIAELKNLKCLKISNNSKISSIGILNGIAKEENLHLTQLDILNVEFTTETYIKISENLPNIQILHIGNSSLTNKGLQAIIKNCTELIDLNLYGSSNITDYGLTGMNEDKTAPILTGHSIQNLNKLQILNLRRCNITEFTLSNGLKLPNLKTLHLPSCFRRIDELPWVTIRKLSLPGFEAFIKNCPNIEVLNLMACSGDTNLDSGISIALEQLKHLKTVKISRICGNVQKDQKSLLKKGRRDLSLMNILCKCETCTNIRKSSQQFVDKL